MRAKKKSEMTALALVSFIGIAIIFVLFFNLSSKAANSESFYRKCNALEMKYLIHSVLAVPMQRCVKFNGETGYKFILKKNKLELFKLKLEKATTETIIPYKKDSPDITLENPDEIYICNNGDLASASKHEYNSCPEISDNSYYTIAAAKKDNAYLKKVLQAMNKIGTEKKDSVKMVYFDIELNDKGELKAYIANSRENMALACKILKELEKKLQKEKGEELYGRIIISNELDRRINLEKADYGIRLAIPEAIKDILDSNTVARAVADSLG